jgi:hypothetical protein
METADEEGLRVRLDDKLNTLATFLDARKILTEICVTLVALYVLVDLNDSPANCDIQSIGDTQRNCLVEFVDAGGSVEWEMLVQPCSDLRFACSRGIGALGPEEIASVAVNDKLSEYAGYALCRCLLEDGDRSIVTSYLLTILNGLTFVTGLFVVAFQSYDSKNIMKKARLATNVTRRDAIKGVLLAIFWFLGIVGAYTFAALDIGTTVQRKVFSVVVSSCVLSTIVFTLFGIKEYKALQRCVELNQKRTQLHSTQASGAGAEKKEGGKENDKNQAIGPFMNPVFAGASLDRRSNAWSES